jgi:hypothetical protein
VPGLLTRSTLLAAAAIALGAAPAATARQINVELTGELTIAWTAESAQGCAAAGLCGISGSLEALPGGGTSSVGGPPDLELSDERAARAARAGRAAALRERLLADDPLYEPEGNGKHDAKEIDGQLARPDSPG